MSGEVDMDTPVDDGGLPMYEPGPEASEIWATLSGINVNDFTETLDKGSYKLTYLSWTWAYTQMMENFPQFGYRFDDNEIHSDGSVTVHVRGWVGHVDRAMWLPVMDHKNKSIINPTSREISDAKMRCLVKCISMFGLGLYIYAGEDLPIEPSGADAAKGKTAAKGKAALTDSEVEKFNTIKTTMLALIEEESNIEDLRAFWKINGKELKNLEAKAKDIFDEILAAFKAKSAEITAQKKEEE